MRYSYTIYLGARNNGDGKISDADYEKIEKIVSQASGGYTLIRGHGFWRGKHEDTAIIVVALKKGKKTPTERINKLCRALLREFEQSEIICQAVGPAYTFKKDSAAPPGDESGLGFSNSENTDWAKARLGQLSNKATAKRLKAKHAISALVKLRHKSPNITQEEVLEHLRQKYPEHAKKIR